MNFYESLYTKYFIHYVRQQRLDILEEAFTSESNSSSRPFVFVRDRYILPGGPVTHGGSDENLAVGLTREAKKGTPALTAVNVSGYVET